jgi:hypothetical protein
LPGTGRRTYAGSGASPSRIDDLEPTRLASGNDMGRGYQYHPSRVTRFSSVCAGQSDTAHEQAGTGDSELVVPEF